MVCFPMAFDFNYQKHGKELPRPRSLFFLSLWADIDYLPPPTDIQNI